MKEKKNDDTIKVLIPTGSDPVSNNTIVKDNAEDKDKNGAPGTDIINHVKEVELIEEDTGARTKSHPNETEITRRSSSRISSVTDTANTEEEEVEAGPEGDRNETANMPVITADSMIIEDPIKKPMASNPVNRKKGNRDSDPQVKLHHAHIGNVLEKSVAGKNANTNISAYSNNHPDGRKTVEKCYALKHDKLEDNKGSELRLDPMGDTKDDYVVLDDSSDYGRRVHLVKPDSEACDKRTTNDPVDVINKTADDVEEEPVTFNSVSQGKAARKSIPREGVHRSPIEPELEDGKAKQEDNNIEGGTEDKKLAVGIDREIPGKACYFINCDSEVESKENISNHMYEAHVSPTNTCGNMPARISDSRIEGGGDDEKGRTYDEEPATDDDDTKHHNDNTAAAQGSNNEGSTSGSGFEDGKVNVNADKIVQIMEIIDDLTEVTNEYVPQQSLQGLTSNGPRLAGMVDDRTKQEDSNIEDKTEVKLTECIEKEMKPGRTC